MARLLFVICGTNVAGYLKGYAFCRRHLQQSAKKLAAQDQQYLQNQQDWQCTGTKELAQNKTIASAHPELYLLDFQSETQLQIPLRKCGQGMVLMVQILSDSGKQNEELEE